MNKLITIIFAYRNRDLERIEISLESLNNQTSKKFDVIFVDYGSSNVFSKPLQELVSSYPFVKYEYVGHEGLLWNKSKAFNYGIRKTETPYILTADVDLIFSPETITLLEKQAQPSSFTLFKYGYLSKKNSQSILKDTPFNTLKPDHYGDVNGVGLYPKNALEEIRGFDEFYHFYGSEDEDLFERLINAGFEKKFEVETLFLHQWHPRYPDGNEKKLERIPRLSNARRINQQHLIRCQNDKKTIPFQQENWGVCFSHEDLRILDTPGLHFRVSNLASSVLYFLNEHLVSCQGEIVAVDFEEDANYLSLKNKIRKIVGKKQQKFLQMKEINDLVLQKIIFTYRHNNYSFRISKDLKIISLTIDLRPS